MRTLLEDIRYHHDLTPCERGETLWNLNCKYNRNIAKLSLLNLVIYTSTNYTCGFKNIPSKLFLNILEEIIERKI